MKKVKYTRAYAGIYQIYKKNDYNDEEEEDEEIIDARTLNVRSQSKIYKFQENCFVSIPSIFASYFLLKAAITNLEFKCLLLNVCMVLYSLHMILLVAMLKFILPLQIW